MTEAPIAALSKEPTYPGGPSQLDLVRVLHELGEPGLTLAEFVAWAWPIVEPSKPLVWNWHMDVLCDHVQAQAEGPALPLTPHPNGIEGVFVGRFGKPWAQNLLINISPGTTKSLIVCVFAHAWVWLWDPNRKRFYSSANPDVVLRDSVKTRDLVTSDLYRQTFRPQWELREDQNAKGLFGNTAMGERKAKGVGASITGSKADDIIVDDPLDAKDAFSKPSRDSVNNDWWDQAAANRVNDLAACMRTIIMQRLHEEDLSGHVLAEGSAWEHLCIPMEYEEQRACKCRSCVRGFTFLGWADPRKIDGELMFPRRFSIEVLKGPRFPDEIGGELRRLGPTGYAGQYQQRPFTAAGNMLRREDWRFWSRDPKQLPRPRGATDLPPLVVPLGTRFDREIQSWDCSFKELSTSDRVVGGVVAKLGGRRLVMPTLFWKVAGLVKTLDGVLEMRLAYPAARQIFIEDKANGSAVIELLKSKITGVTAVEPEGGKEARAAAAMPLVEAHDVYLPEGAWWLEQWFDETAAFPSGKHDDAVDFFSQAIRALEDTPDAMRAAALLGIRR